MHGEQQLSAIKEAMDEERIKLVDKIRMDLEKKRPVVLFYFYLDFEIISWYTCLYSAFSELVNNLLVTFLYWKVFC